MSSRRKILFFSDGVDESVIRRIIIATSVLFDKLKIEVESRWEGDIWKGVDDELLKDISTKLVRIRVTRWDKVIIHDFVSPAEINFETRRARGEIKSFGIVYDGFLLSSVFFKILDGKSEDLPVVFTNRQIATFGEDGRYHLRIAVLGLPSVISVNGFFSAPAKPIEYHITKMVDQDTALIKGETIKNYIEKNIPFFARAYVLEALLWNILGVPFCSNKTCFLSDSHTTDELILSKKGRFNLCKIHKEAVSVLRR